MTFYSPEWADEAKTIIRYNNGSAITGKNTMVGRQIVDSGVTIKDYEPPAATWDSVRGERNQLLKDTDWQAGTDVTMSDAQKAYRKKLRDLPATNADPTKIVFPDAP